MGRFYDAVSYGQPVLDLGWRVAIHPAGTSLLDAVTHEQVVQGELGNELLAASVSRLSAYYVKTTGDFLADGETESRDPGWRDVVAMTGAVVIRYRVTGPRIHA